MTLILIIFFISVLSFIIPLMSQPLSFGLTLLVSTFFMTLLTATFSSTWYAYMIFLIFIGGLLVMFAYISALAPNSHFKTFQPSLVFSLLTSLYLITLTFLFSPPFPTTPQFFETSMFLTHTSSIIYSPLMIPTLFFLLYILLLTMIAVAKICSLYLGPLRPYK